MNEIKRLGDLRPGVKFYFSDNLPSGLHVRTEGGRVRLENGVITQDFPCGISKDIEVLPVDSLDTTYEEAIEAATPKALTFGDLAGGEEFRAASGGSAVFVKLAHPVKSTKYPDVTCTAIWKRDAWPCVYYDFNLVERVEDGGVGAE